MTADLVTDYLAKLERGLRPLLKEDRTAILAEIESHIADCITSGHTAVAEVLEHLGSPEELAQSYVEQYRLSDALAGSKHISLLFLVLERATCSILALATGLTAALLYAFALSFTVMAVLKPILPNNVGMWVGDHVFDFGAIDKAPAGGHEILGYWIVPVSILLAVACYLIGAKLMRFTGRRLLRARFLAR